MRIYYVFGFVVLLLAAAFITFYPRNNSGKKSEVEPTPDDVIRTSPETMRTQAVADRQQTPPPTTSEPKNLDYLILPVKKVGLITPKSTEAELIAAYGASNIRRGEISLGEGETVPGSILFGDTPDEIKIVWEKDFAQPNRIIISNQGAHWKTKSGITVGSTLASVEKINGRAFKLTGFSSDYEGRSVSWEKGKIPKQLVLDFSATTQVSDKEEDSVTGDIQLSSKNPVIIKKQLVVRTVYVIWEK